MATLNKSQGGCLKRGSLFFLFSSLGATGAMYPFHLNINNTHIILNPKCWKYFYELIEKREGKIYQTGEFLRFPFTDGI